MCKLYFIAFLLIGCCCSVFSYKLKDGRDECCETKTVGDVTYELVKKMDTSGFDCISNCVYKPVAGNSSSSFCFKRGDLPVTCTDEASISLCPTKITDEIKNLLPKIKEGVEIVGEIKKIADEAGLGPEVDKFLTEILTFLEVVERLLEALQKFCDEIGNTTLSICPDDIIKLVNEAIPLVEKAINAVEEIKKILDAGGLGPIVNPLLAKILTIADESKTILDDVKSFCDILEADQVSSEIPPGLCPVDRSCRNKQGECQPIICRKGFVKIGDCLPIVKNCVCCRPQ